MAVPESVPGSFGRARARAARAAAATARARRRVAAASQRVGGDAHREGGGFHGGASRLCGLCRGVAFVAFVFVREREPSEVDVLVFRTSSSRHAVTP